MIAILRIPHLQNAVVTFEYSLRRVQVSAAGQSIAPAKPGVDRFRVTPPQPQIVSIDPLFLVAGEPAVELTIQGQLLDEVSSVSVIPSDGITVNTPVPDPSGTSVTVQMSASANAELTPRVITVQTPGGSSSTVAGPQNTLQIVSDVDSIVTPILSLPLGINKQTSAPPAPTVNRLIASTLLGVESITAA